MSPTSPLFCEPPRRHSHTNEFTASSITPFIHKWGTDSGNSTEKTVCLHFKLISFYRSAIWSTKLAMQFHAVPFFLISATEAHRKAISKKKRRQKAASNKTAKEIIQHFQIIFRNHSASTDGHLLLIRGYQLIVVINKSVLYIIVKYSSIN